MVLIIEKTVAYMLMVLKSKVSISAYKNEFNAIHHGDYKEFLKLIKEPIPFMIKYQNGIITNEEENPNYDCDFEGLLKSGPSLKMFYTKCTSFYGKILDNDIPEDIYYKVVTFEIAIRMHANNNNLLNNSNRIELEKVIDILCCFKNISAIDNKKIHGARRFVNMIKHF
ncbi:MAG: hypothetical protein Q8R57_04565, partial [Bacteroidota bacterium]|nr:hypothetical protein [Bacteroidota bacterium]